MLEISFFQQGKKKKKKKDSTIHMFKKENSIKIKNLLYRMNIYAATSILKQKYTIAFLYPSIWQIYFYVPKIVYKI